MQKLPKLLPQTTRGAIGSVSLNEIPRSKKGTLTSTLSAILQDVQREIGFVAGEGEELATLTEEELRTLVDRTAQRFGFQLSASERDEILEHIERDQRPFGVLQELVDDTSISDIIVSDYSKITVQQARKNLATDLSFSNQEAYETRKKEGGACH